LVVDASASMGFRSARAPAAKLAYAALISAALARIALAGGDPVALDWIGGEQRRPLPAMGGREAFERVISVLESVRPGGDLSMDDIAFERALAPLARYAGRGSLVVLFSDLVDLPTGAIDRFAALGTRGRSIVAVRVLDPSEERFPFEGPLRLRSLEGDVLTETDAEAARVRYLAALERIASSWDARLVSRGGRLVRASTDQDPVEVVRRVLHAAEGGAS